jgi:hypothetical protein
VYYVDLVNPVIKFFIALSEQSCRKPLLTVKAVRKESAAMASTALRQLISERDKLEAEIEALRHKVEGLEIAIRLVSDELSPTPSASESRPGVSNTLVSLLRTAGENGLKPLEAIEIAERDGKHLNRGSVYSLLNRMQRVGIVAHENARYYLRSEATAA